MTKDELTKRVDELVDTIETARKMAGELSSAASYYENYKKDYKLFQVNACAISFMARLRSCCDLFEAMNHLVYPIKNELHRDYKTHPERIWESYLSVVNSPGKENGGLFAYQETR